MKKILFAFAGVLLASCGWHLKGNKPYDSLAVQAWQVEGGALQQDLENVLRLNNARAVSAVYAQASVQVLNVNQKKDIYTITRAAKLNEYLLTMRVLAQASRNGKAWGEPIEVYVQRTMPYADSMVLGKEEEEATIWKEMRRDAAEQIVRRLAFLPQ